ncbi:hypothetical protein JCM18899A_09640 [Nocardioides sp. AN3]
MFAHHCSACEATYLIFESQLISMTNTSSGIELRFACWCGAEQTTITGRLAGRRTADAVAA